MPREGTVLILFLIKIGETLQHSIKYVRCFSRSKQDEHHRMFYLTSVIVLQSFFDRNYKLWTLPFSFKAPILAMMCVYLHCTLGNTDWPHTAQVIFTTYVIFFPSFSSDPAEFTSRCRLVNRAAAGRSRLTAAVRGSLFFITIHI